MAANKLDAFCFCGLRRLQALCAHGSHGILRLHSVDRGDLSSRRQDFDNRARELPGAFMEERPGHVSSLFPANPGYEFQILYRRKG
jgi:hypothetical protein